jgi:Domain of unknown function (DUF4352)
MKESTGGGRRREPLDTPSAAREDSVMQAIQAMTGAAVCALLLAGSGCAPAVAPRAKIYRMGERVTLGSLVYNVFETQWKAQLGQGPGARIPKDRFFLVRLSVVNGGSADVMVPTMVLVDDAGHTYPELSDGDQVPSWIGFLRRVKPADTLQGNIVFDVPPKHYRLRLSDENEQKSEEVDVPLSFASEAPVAPPPTE